MSLFKPTQQMLEDTYTQDDSLGIPRGTTANQIGVESSWNPQAVSDKGARGYVQVIPSTLAAVQSRLGRTLDPSDWKDALDIHRTLMAENLKHFGNVPDSLRAYNSGWNRDKWNNPETAAYVPKILGVAPAPAAAADAPQAAAPTGTPDHPLAGYQTVPERMTPQEADGTAGLSTLSKGIQLREQMAGEIGDNAQAVVDEAAMQTRGEASVEQQNASTPATLAEDTHQVGWGESMVQGAMWTNLTGALTGWLNAGSVDPNFKIEGKEHDRLIADYPAVYANDDLRDYVLAANSAHDWEHRLFAANERADWMTRSAHTGGVTAEVGTILGGMADPVAIAATMGLGSVVNVVRAERAFAGALAEGRSAAAANAAALASRGGYVAAGIEGFGVTAGLDSSIRALTDQKQDVPASIQQGLVGAGLGLLGHGVLSAFRKDPTYAAAHDAIDRRVQATTDNPMPSGYRWRDDPAGQLTDNVHDVPAGPWAPDASREAPAPAGKYDFTPPEEGAAPSAETAEVSPARREVAARLGYEPTPTIGGEEFAKLHAQGAVVELRSADDLAKASPFHAKYGEEVPADAKALYSPQDDVVYVFRDRLTPEEAANPRGLMMHEVGVHYGLERTLGTEMHSRILRDLEASTDPRAHAARAAVPADTPAHLRGEEALGYLVERHPDLPFVARTLAVVRNFLRDNVRAFKGLKVTTADAVAYVKGTLKKVQRQGVRADATFPYAYHGGPTRGIDKLDLAFSGSGEGNAAYGHGHYLTSEKGTALDYRNKESARRGKAPEEGGLYTVKVKTARENLLHWDKPVEGQAVAGKVAHLPGETGEQLYKRLTKELGSQRAASEHLNAAGVHGLEYATGRTRGRATPNHNFVLFGNEHLDIANRYSRTQHVTAEEVRAHVPLHEFAAPDQHMTGSRRHALDPAERGRSHSLKDLLENLLDGRDRQAAALASRILDHLQDDIRVHHMTDLPEKVMGAYFKGSHTIGLRSLDDPYVLLHEAAHGLSSYKIHYGLENPDTPIGKIVAELDDMRKMLKEVHESEHGGADAKTEYYTTNADEFVSGLFSGKKKFQEILASFDWYGAPLLSRMFDAVRRLLGIEASESSALAHAMGLSEKLFNERLDTRVSVDGYDRLLIQQEIEGPPAPESELHRFNKTAAEVAWARRFHDHVETTTVAQERGRRYYQSGFLRKLMPAPIKQLLDSQGMKLGLSTNKATRLMASALGEDATGINRQHGMSAAIDADRLRRGWMVKMSEAYNHLAPKLFSAKEMALEAGFQNGAAHKRIGKQVAEYQAAKRSAKAAGSAFDESTFDPQIVAIGKSLDAHWGRIWEASKAAGFEEGKALGSGKAGFEGFMPYRWNWSDIHSASVNDPAKFDALVKNFRSQYIAKVVDPAMIAAVSHGPVQADVLNALREQLHDKANALTENYITKVMQDPKSRTAYQQNHIAKITEDLLKNDFRGEKITNETVAAVKAKLQEIITSRERTEFDLLADHDGVRLLDFLDTDIERMVTSTSHRYAGDIALTRKGLGDPLQVEAMLNALTKSGASAADRSGIEFMIRAVGGDLTAQESGLAKWLRQMAYSSMMGGVGFNALADTASTTTLVGVGGMMKVVGKMLQRKGGHAPMLDQINALEPGLLSHDARLMQATVDHTAGEQHAFSEGSVLMNFSAKSADLTSTLSGLKAVSKLQHNAFVPYLMREVMDTIMGNGNISPARMADLGLSPERMQAIAAEVHTHNPGWKGGDAIDWTHWNQLVADDFVGAIHRGSAQALQRAYVGEHPRWMSESSIGQALSQFKAFGWLAGEKQLMRNLFINDSNTWAAFAVALPMASLLFRAKLESGMIGMTDAQRDQKLREVFDKDHGIQAFLGTMSMMNNSGMVQDVADVGYTFMFGQSHGASGSPAASLGYMSALKNAAAGVGHAGKDILTGDGQKVGQDLAPVMRALPAGNTPWLHTIGNEFHQ